MNVLVENKGGGSIGREHQAVMLDMQAAGSPSAADIRVELEVLRQSRTFGGSGRLISFLSYLVEETIEGRGSGLRETAIGNAIYQRSPPYDPRIDSTVRVEARRLRKKLEQYFDTEGRADPVILIVPVGSYIPRFSINSVAFRQSPGPGQSVQPETAAKSRHMSVAVYPFRTFSSREPIADFSESLAEEIIHVLGTVPNLDLRSRLLSTAERRGERFDDDEILTSDMLVQGSIKEHQGNIQVTVELSDASGTLIFSDRFLGFLADAPQLEAKIARTLLERLRPDKVSKHRDPKVYSTRWHARICRARNLADRQTEASLQEAASIYEDLSEIVPFVGQLGIVDCCCDLFRIGALDRERAIKRAETALCAALALDPVLGPTPAVSFVVSAWLGGHWPTRIEDIKTVFPQSGSSRSLRIHGLELTALGLHEQAERLFAEAREIEPFSQHQDILEAFSRYQSRIYKPPVGFDPGSIGHGSQEAIYYSALSSYFGGDVEGARTLAATLRRDVLGNPSLFYAREELNALLGHPEDAQRILHSPRAEATYFAKATIASALRDPLLAVENLSRSVASREFASRWIKTDPRFDWLRGTPEYETCVSTSDIRWL